MKETDIILNQFCIRSEHLWEEGGCLKCYSGFFTTIKSKAPFILFLLSGRHEIRFASVHGDVRIRKKNASGRRMDQSRYSELHQGLRRSCKLGNCEIHLRIQNYDGDRRWTKSNLPWAFGLRQDRKNSQTSQGRIRATRLVRFHGSTCNRSYHSTLST